MKYRNLINGEYNLLELMFKHSNILVGFNELKVSREEFYLKLQSHLSSLYDELESFISYHPSFRATLQPWKKQTNNMLVDRMIKYTSEADVGPMASVAGAYADELLEIAGKYSGSAFIENGGDIALRNKEEVSMMIYPGWGSFDSKVSIKIPKGQWGIASSSGLFGHSLSHGQADMISVLAENSIRADSFATAIANQIVPGCEPLEILNRYSNLDAVLIIWKGKIWYKGDFELVFDK